MKTGKDDKEEQKTDFKGPVSLEAILAAKSAAKSKENGGAATQTPATPATPLKKEEPKKQEPQKTDDDKSKEGEAQGQQQQQTDDDKSGQGSAQQPKPGDNVEETDAYKTALKMIASGMLQDFEIQDPYSEEDKAILVSEFKGMSEENLSEIIKIDKEAKEQNISSNYISKDGLKEHQLKVIEILKNGGDLSQIADSPEKALTRPFEGFDLEDQQRQIDVVYTDKVNGKGLSHDEAVALINIEIKNGTLKDSAQKIYDAYQMAHDKYIDDILDKQRKDKEHKDLNFKENKKSLTAKLKEAGFKESVYKKVAAEYAKKNQSGDFLLIDKLRDALNNPDKNYELILHLADKKLFNETFKIKAAQESQKTIVRLATGAASKGNRKSGKTNQGTDDQKAPWELAAEAYNEKIKAK